MTKKDWCTGWPDRNEEQGMDWSSCCEEHDKCYDRGGSSADRKVCDLAFRECLKEKSDPINAWWMYRAVRLFGGFGHRFNRTIFLKKR